MKQIDFEVTLENYADDVRRLYGLFRPNARPEEIQCKEFETGVVNRVVKLDDPGSNGPLVFRIFRMRILETLSADQREKQRSSASLSNRALELEAVRKASELGISVSPCATFRNGFIYRFIDGDLLTFETYDYETARKVAAKIARLHRMDLGALAGRTPSVYWVVGTAGDPKTTEEEREFFDRKMKESEFEEHRSQLPGYKAICEEMEQIHERILEKDAYGPVCFCHNDLNLTNLLIERSPEREPILLDFEWANTNFQMFDLSVHLLSIGNRLGCFSRPGEPSESFIKHWLRCYYEEANRLDRRTATDFEPFIENELKKVLANMLLIRLLVIKLSIESAFRYPGQMPAKQNAQYAVKVYDEFRAIKDQHLCLLDTLRKF